MTNRRFGNRQSEMGLVAGLVERLRNPIPGRVSRPVVMVTDPRSGLSSFLEHCIEDLRDQTLAFVVDGAIQEPGTAFQQILIQLKEHYDSVWNRFNRYIDRMSGDTVRGRVVAAGLSCIPYIGSALSDLFKAERSILPVTQFPSFAAEVLGRFFQELSEEQQSLILVDNAQDLDAVSLGLLELLCSPAYSHIQFIACFVRRPEARFETPDDFLRALRLLRSDCEMLAFESPGANLVREIAHVYGITLPARVDRAIARAAAGDIFLVLESLRELAGDQQLVPGDLSGLSPAALFTLQLLFASRQALRRSDVVLLVTSERTLFLSSETDVHAALGELSDAGFVTTTTLPSGDALLVLRQQSAMDRLPRFQGAAMLRVATVLYEYFLNVEQRSLRHAAPEYVPLLYRLAKLVDRELVPRHLRSILRLSIAMGSLGGSEMFSKTAFGKLGEGDISDYYGQLANLAAQKAYEELLSATADPQLVDWNRTRPARIFRAIALNRMRRHSDSEELLCDLCASSRSRDELAILASYRIVGRLHANDTRGARELYHSLRDELEGCSRFGYFCRNAAAAFDPAHAITLQREAIESLKASEDEFGVATTSSNLAGDLASLGETDEALQLVEESYRVLSVYGVQHLNIVEGNRCHCLLHAHRFQDAEAVGVHSLRFMGTDLPRVYTMINIAAARSLSGDHAGARLALRDGEDALRSVEVNRASQKFYSNAAAIGLFLHFPRELVAHYLKASREHPDTRQVQDGERIRRRMQVMLNDNIRISGEQFWRIFSPCILLYWYEDPLEAIVFETLPSEAPTQDSRDKFSV